MILDLARKLNSIDSDLSLTISASNSGTVTFGVRSDYIGDLYTYSSTSTSECYEKILNFIDCLEDSDKFDELVNEILEVPMEV